MIQYSINFGFESISFAVKLIWEIEFMVVYYNMWHGHCLLRLVLQRPFKWNGCIGFSVHVIFGLDEVRNK